MVRHTFAEDRARARQAGAARQAKRAADWSARLASAQSAEAAVQVAFDWFRASTARMSRRGVTRTGHAPNRPDAERLMRQMAAALAGAAREADTTDSTEGDSP